MSLAAAVYVYAGTQLAHISSLNAVFFMAHYSGTSASCRFGNVTYSVAYQKYMINK
jgi:hypothetical protein